MASVTEPDGKELMSRKPLIGITTSYVHREGRVDYAMRPEYAKGVELAGGIPVLLPHRVDHAIIPDLLDRLDGVIFSGGLDLDPASYGEAKHPGAEQIDPHREAFERALIAEVDRRRVPTLGICLGSQLMNVHRGGSLHQFLPDLGRSSSLEHRDFGPEVRHPVEVVEDSILEKIAGTRHLTVNTFHKQSINRLGRGLRVVARAPDGVIEGVEDPEYPTLFLGVQWHPERMLDDPKQLRLFEQLVQHASARR
jgi:putative glutamine amidotransferase